MSDENFLSPDNFSLRAISPKWVNERARQLSPTTSPDELDVGPVLEEIADRLKQRAAWNYREDGDILIYPPSEDTDPYIFAIPIKKHRSGTEQRSTPANTPVCIRPDVKTSTLRAEFENILFEQEGGFDPNDLARNENDEYVNEAVHNQWIGFEKYHEKLTVAGSPNFRDEFNKVLGRWVVCKVSANGTALFIKTPFRHPTRALATEDAVRLIEEHNAPFAIFRCIDILHPEEPSK